MLNEDRNGAANNKRVPEITSFHPEEYSIIIIDDDRDHLDLFREYLAGQGFRVHARTSPKEGLQLMKRIYFDLLICDLKMPEITGIEVIEELRKIKSIPSGSRLPIIMLSASGESWESTALAVGADIFCQKRNAMTELLPRIRQLLEE